MSKCKRTMRLGLLPVGGDHDLDFKHLARWAKVSEEGRLDFIFLWDVAACRPAQGRTKLEPLTLASTLAAMTRHIGLVTTASTSLNHPFALARRLASVDHLSQGRAGWNLATTATPDEQLNHSLDGAPASATRYERAREFLDVVQGLFDGWEPGAFIRDRATGVYMDPAKMHRLRHAGQHFKVRGPSDVDRPPQGALPIITEATSDGDKDFAAEVADMVFGGQPSIEIARAHYSATKARLAYHGRTPDGLRMMPTIMPMIGRTQAEAEDLFASLPTPMQGPAHFTITGTPTLIADTMEEWFATGAADGFVIQPPYLADGVRDFVHAVIPELQRRGLFRLNYDAATLRGNLGMTPVAEWRDPSARNMRYPAI